VYPCGDSGRVVLKSTVRYWWGFNVVVGSIGIPRAANRAQNIVPAEIRVWSEHYSGKFLIRFGHPCGDTCLSGKYQRDVGIPETV